VKFIKSRESYPGYLILTIQNFVASAEICKAKTFVRRQKAYSRIETEKLEPMESRRGVFNCNYSKIKSLYNRKNKSIEAFPILFWGSKSLSSKGIIKKSTSGKARQSGMKRSDWWGRKKSFALFLPKRALGGLIFFPKKNFFLAVSGINNGDNQH